MSSTANPTAVNEYAETKKLVPIVFVPGTMGTRLATDDGKTLVWNPGGALLRVGTNVGGTDYELSIGLKKLGDRSPGNLAFNAEIIQSLATPLKPIGRFNKIGDDDTSTIPGGDLRYPTDLIESARNIRYFFSAIPEFYDKLLFALSRDPKHPEDLTKDLADSGLEPRVFVAGYDWRQSCADAATAFVDPVVQEALDTCAADKVILVAHSMGGPVARHYCKYVGGDRVLGLILITSPLLGAMKAYSWIKKGFALDDGSMFGMRVAFFGQLANRSSIRFNRSLPSIYEMLPTRIFAAQAKDWLEFDKDDNQTGYPYTFPPGDIPIPTHHLDATDPYGLTLDPFTGVGDDEATRVESARMLANAEQFQFNLTVPGIAAEGEVRKVYLPENTYIIYAKGLPTKTTGRLERYGDIVLNTDTGVVTYVAPLLRLEVPLEVDQPTTGDGTVPGASAFPWVGCLSVPPKDWLLIEGSDAEKVEHSAMPGNETVTKTVREWIVRILSEAG